MLNLRSKIRGLGDWFRKKNIVDVITVAIFISAFVALLVLVWLYVRPIPTANIKVPVATDQASYYPGEDISGIFFGDTYYSGEVRILREVFCKNYKGVIKPPAESADGNFFATQARPRHLEGQSVNVGALPSNIPVGANCVLQFTNVYEIQTPFGLRRIEYQYYTQNFAIVTLERRQQLECEASGRKDCNFLNDSAASAAQPVPTPEVQSSPETPPAVQQSPVYNDNRSTTNNNTTITNPPAEQEPAPQYEEKCVVNLLGVKIACRQVLVTE